MRGRDVPEPVAPEVAAPPARRAGRAFAHRSVQTAAGGLLLALVPFGVALLAGDTVDRHALAGVLGAGATTLIVSLFRLTPARGA